MRLIRRLYDWVLHWANTPYGTPALFLLAVAESSFFPVPPDVLLMALGLSIPKRALRYAVICTVGSVIGGMLGYLIGLQFWEFGQVIIFKYVDEESFNLVRKYFIEYEAWAVAAAGLTPVPYKVFTISAGFLRADFTVFVVASVLARGARFFAESLMIYAFGPSIKTFIDRYFNILTIVFMILLLGGFIFLKYVL